MPPAPCIPEKEVRNLKTTAQRKAAFLRALGDSGSIAKSARVAGIDRTTHYEWLAKDPRYRARFEGASAMRRDTVLDALMERAVFGVFKPIIYKGKFCREPRCRIICQLADGTSAFADELPKGARVMESRVVTTYDGALLGVYRKDVGASLKVAAILMPEKYGHVLRRKRRKPPADPEW